jgi:chemotaxis protein histidine kinase CheA
MSMDAIQQMLRQLRDGFLGELPERLDRLEALMLAMEGASDGGEAFREAFRMVHSIKGSGGTHGLHILTTICHALEDSLQASAADGVLAKDGVDLCLRYVDLLRNTAVELVEGQEDFAHVLERLASLRSGGQIKLQRVMLLEPSRLSSAIYAQGLKGLPLDIVHMGDGYQALHRLLKEPFRLLITANELDTLNGPALLSAVRLSNSANAAIKAILITSTFFQEKHRVRKTDADLVLGKDSSIGPSLRQGVRGLLELADS